MSFMPSFFKRVFAVFITFSVSSVAFSTDNASVEFFYSNNKSIITVKKAYERLIGAEQYALTDSMITFLQKNHFEQGRLANILGLYQSNDRRTVTGDNAEIYYASPLQKISEEQVLNAATNLSKTLKQESVAVFVPSQHSDYSNIVVTFKSNQPTVVNLVNRIRKKLPAYSSAFSLHLRGYNQSFADSKVIAVEWLGKKVKIEDIRNEFPAEKITARRGHAYLVYQDGNAVVL
jgi:hypothetical protein